MKYFAKLLLFGEYTIIHGSQALAIPFSRFKGAWRYAPDKKDRQKNLVAFAKYLSKGMDSKNPIVQLDIDLLEQDLEEGLYFKSNIPVGYGLGSSGALCAAVYDRYALDPYHRKDAKNYPELKESLAWMERFFHGSSSGIDPFICYLKQPVLLGGKRPVRLRKFPDTEDLPFHLFLLNTGKARQTQPLVNLFLKNYEQKKYCKKIEKVLVPTVEEAIDNFLKEEWKSLIKRFREISELQWTYFRDMIPDTVAPLWKKGIESGDFSLKLCGAGGGGYMLGLTKDTSVLKKLEKRFPIELVFE
ncbi:MAG: mevalonate kinase [Saprospiraceae bacterium]|nr:MAG: mevalonate kinase [Saprospiraceae bacterium]